MYKYRSRIINILKKVFLLVVDNKLPPLTAPEIDLINEYKKKFKLLSSQASLDPPDITDGWEENIKKLINHIENDDMRSFLRWEIIQKTMFDSFSPYLKFELNYLKQSRDWLETWHKAIEENISGYPIPFYLHKRSSGNLIHHAYHIAQFKQIADINIDKLQLILEFGGGYGSMCRLFNKLNFKGSYIIYDLEYFSLLQEYYLKSIIINNYHTKWEINYYYCISNFIKLKNKLDTLRPNQNQNTLFIATWSLSESPIEIRKLFESILQQFKFILIAYQSNYNGIDNNEYFNTIVKNMDNYEWINYKIDHIPNSYYLFGKLN